MTLKQTFANIWSDFQFFSQLMKTPLSAARIVFLITNPATFAITFYRLYRWIYLKNLHALSWICWQMNIVITGADILPTADIDAPIFVGHSVGMVISGKIGKRVKILAQVGMGGGTDLVRDVGAGPGMPYLQDDVQVGARALILGPVLIGENAKIGPLTFVSKDVPANSTAIGNPCKIIPGQGAKDLITAENLTRL